MYGGDWNEGAHGSARIAEGFSFWIGGMLA
jgi:hypothetical protein